MSIAHSWQKVGQHRITEADLILNVQKKTVKRFKIIQGPHGRYTIVVTLTWREEELTLMTARKTVKEWASLDRLVRHIQEHYGDVPTIWLILNTRESSE
ncbi:uncharacterized protein sS8_0564 [Methylocaldum marinum]|uniref:Uncharacterized protein n=1 Tax=Methylocaldum marinum TaxID=1432792 RepID=A0A250KRY2_9GAMM|nr:hypothetical protein [Methylocaldum marinum]BBA32529.1 uncharacterized protein sS8_0564 [Methylocaldum marinum]